MKDIIKLSLVVLAILFSFSQCASDKKYVIFAASRENPIRPLDSIPQTRIKGNTASGTTFNTKVAPGEYFVFQIGLYAKDDLKGLGYRSRLPGISCFNLEGTDHLGKPFTKIIDLKKGKVQPLWFGMQIPESAKGDITGVVKLTFKNANPGKIKIKFKVSGAVVENHGYNKGNRLSRLNWLNSTVGIDEEVTKGFLPVEVKDNQISILGRTLTIAENGLPASIISYFNGSNQSLVKKGQPVVNRPFRFIVETENGEMVRLIPGNLTITRHTPSQIAWKVLNTSDTLSLECSGRMAFDGFVDYRLKLSANTSVQVKDIRLEIPVEPEKAEYMMGLGHEGGIRTPDWKWRWDVTKNQDMLWVGAVNGGLRVKWKAENYARPLINIYYKFGQLKRPPSWDNGGKGGVQIDRKNDDVVIRAFSGIREMKPGEILNYDFELLLTPFKLIDKQRKYGDRYYHGGGPNTSIKIENAKKGGANIINIHHAEDIYPFINYPYLDANVAELTQLVANAHKENMRIKLYYTTRELTKNLPEFWALNSLNGEVIFPGPGNASRTEALHPDGPNEWLIKNLREHYIPAWFNLVKEGKFKGETDLSVITTPDSRLNNFYIAGLDWMVQNMKIDGVYIDDSALDRQTLIRARKIIDQYRPQGRMDLHSWNHFNEWAGFANCLNLYMDLLPYIDLCWIGEGRDYDRLPDHWLVEVSGIPFGVPGQMLQGGGNRWRGMVFGITNRLGWHGPSPEFIWQFWDEYNIQDMEMFGFWDDNCPVKTNNRSLVTTIYKGNGKTIMAIANWSNESQHANLEIDWKALGLDMDKTKIQIPYIQDYQNDMDYSIYESITIEGGKGYLIVLQEE